MEEIIRYQLEMADLVQGFQLSIDTNSGFASLGKQMINYFLKDEVPKAPVYIYSVNNENSFDRQGGEGMDEEEILNLQKMR